MDHVNTYPLVDVLRSGVMLDCVSQLSSADLGWEHVHNPRVDAKQPYPAALRHILNFQGFLAAKQVV
jgi:hypothetical protein